MPRLKIRFIIEFEYDADPKDYGLDPDSGFTDEAEIMAAIDQKNALEYPEQSLQEWLISDTTDKNITIEGEVVHD